MPRLESTQQTIDAIADEFDLDLDEEDEDALEALLLQGPGPPPHAGGLSRRGQMVAHCLQGYLARSGSGLSRDAIIRSAFEMADRALERLDGNAGG